MFKPNGDLSFVDRPKKAKIQTLSHEDKVQNYIEGLNGIDKNDKYAEHVKAKMFTQFRIKKGLKNFSDEGKRSVMKEMDNMGRQNVFGKIVFESLRPQQKKQALPILLFMVLKPNGTLKSRAYADCCQQQL